MRNSFKTLLVLAGLIALLPLASCNGDNSACSGFSCDEGSSCLIVDGNPECVADGGVDGGGQNGPGEECDDDADCQSGLTCQADLNGNTVCSD